MRLNYKILWFEDDEGFFESLNRDDISRHLDAKGFNTEIKRMGGGEALQTVLGEARKSDLLVIDYGLEESHFGDELIAQIRGGNINTEVIFYSAKGVGDLRKFVYDKELDGVYCRPRDGITQEVLPIIDSTIRKILDLENSRGLAMAELGELDLVMNEIIITVHGSSEEGQAFIRGKMRERLQGQVESLSKGLEKIDTLPIEELVEHLDSYKRLNTMVSICKELKLTSHQEKLNGFDKNVIFPRDCLGHGIPEETETGCIFRHRGKEYVYDEESSATLRNDFRNFRRCLEDLLKEILGQPKSTTNQS
jgi:CheY-like chemotaxis protein